MTRLTTTASSAFRTAAQQARERAVHRGRSTRSSPWATPWSTAPLAHQLRPRRRVHGWCVVASWVLLSPPGIGRIGFLGCPHRPIRVPGRPRPQCPGAPIDSVPLLIFYLAIALAITYAVHRRPETCFISAAALCKRLAPLITAIGVSFILQNVMLVAAGLADPAATSITFCRMNETPMAVMSGARRGALRSGR